MKEYQIKKTIHGPAVLYKDELIFFEQVLPFFDLFDEYPEALFELSEAVCEHLRSEMEMLIESVSDRRLIDTTTTNSAILMLHHFWRLVNNEYPLYNKARMESQNTTWDLSDEKAKIIHDYYSHSGEYKTVRIGNI